MIEFSIRQKIRIIITILSLFCTTQLFALEYTLPSPETTLIGEIQYGDASFTDSTASFANRYGLGLNSIIAANPTANEMKLNTKHLVVPTSFILPPVAREGMVINLPEMRVYYFPENSNKVLTYPIGIGKIGNTIPIQDSSIVKKALNPNWIPGPDVRKYNKEQGVDLPAVIPPGPDNPLGHYAIYLSIPTFLMHSTVFPESVGRRASFGCIRMNENDIRELFPIIQPGTKVTILNLANKAAWRGDKLYLEAHPVLKEHDMGADANLQDIVATIENQLTGTTPVLIDWQYVAHLASEPDGIPHEIGRKLKTS